MNIFNLMFDVIKKMQCTMYIQNDSIDWCFEKVFQNALDKKLLTDRFTIITKKFKRILKKHQNSKYVHTFQMRWKTLEKHDL